MDFSLIPSGLQPEKDWTVVYNSKVKKQLDVEQLDVDLAFTLSHQSVVCSVRFSADGKFLATGCSKSAQVYDTQTGAKICVLIDEEGPNQTDTYIRSLCFTPDGNHLITGGEDGLIRMWDIANGRINRIFQGHQADIYSLNISLDGSLLVSGSGDSTVRIWKMESGAQTILKITDSTGIDAGVTSVAISPDNKLVAAGSLDSITRIWDVETGNLIERLRGHGDSVYSIALTPDGKGLVSASLDHTLKYWDITPLTTPGAKFQPLPIPMRTTDETENSTSEKDSGEQGSKCTLTFRGHKDFVLATAVSPDGRWVFSGSKDRSVQIWDRESAQMQVMVQGHKNSVIAVDASRQGGMFATGSGDWQVRIWRYATI